jgi:hypothetical protein
MQFLSLVLITPAQPGAASFDRIIQDSDFATAINHFFFAEAKYF